MKLQIPGLPRLWKNPKKRVRHAKSHKAYRTKGDTLRDARQYDEAAKAYSAYLDEVNDDFDIWVQKGNCLKEAGFLTQAKAAYDHALKLRADDADLYMQIGHLAKISGDFPKALVAYKKSLEFGSSLDASIEIENDSALLNQVPSEEKTSHAITSQSLHGTAIVQDVNFSQGAHAIKKVTLLPKRLHRDEVGLVPNSRIEAIKATLSKQPSVGDGAV